MADSVRTEDAALRADIRELGEILGMVLRDQWGEELFELEEGVRLATRELRAQPDEARDTIYYFERLFGGIAAGTADRLFDALAVYGGTTAEPRSPLRF